METTKSSVGVDRTVFTPAHRSGSEHVETRSPCSCTERARPLLRLSHPPLRPAGRPLWRCRGSSRGSLSREPFHSEGWSHTCPHQTHSPQARRPARTSHLLGESQNPLPQRSAQPAAAWSRAPSLCAPRGLNTGTQVDGTPPRPRRGPWGLRAGEEGRPGRRGQHRPAPHPEGGQVHGCQSRQTGTKATRGHLHVQTPLAGSASPAHHAHPPDLPTGESSNGLCIFSYQFPGKCLDLQCVQVSQPPEGPRLDLSDSVKAKIPVKTREVDYLQRNPPVSLVLCHL